MWDGRQGKKKQSENEEVRSGGKRLGSAIPSGKIDENKMQRGAICRGGLILCFAKRALEIL